MCLLGCVTGLAAVHATDRHVAPNGSDSNIGSAEAPFREIRKALTVTAPGDRVFVADGNYKGFDAVSIGSAGAAPTVIMYGRQRSNPPISTVTPHTMAMSVLWLNTRFASS